MLLVLTGSTPAVAAAHSSSFAVTRQLLTAALARANTISAAVRPSTQQGAARHGDQHHRPQQPQHHAHQRAAAHQQHAHMTTTARTPTAAATVHQAQHCQQQQQCQQQAQEQVAASRMAGTALHASLPQALAPAGGCDANQPASRLSPAGIKSAKRKAAEAFLAAQYGGCLGAGHTTSATRSRLGPGCPHDASCRLVSSSAAACQQQHLQQQQGARTEGAADAGSGESSSEAGYPTLHSHLKQPRMSVAGAILKLGGGFVPAQHTAAPAYAAAAAATATAVASDKQQLEQQQQQQQQPYGHAQHGSLVIGALDASQQLQQQQQQQQQAVHVPACDDDCEHALSHGWCHSQVRLPHVDWGRVMGADVGSAARFKVADGYQRIMLPGSVQVLVVEQQVHLPAALEALRRSMLDSVVAIDLEWRPQFSKGFTPVAMVQLASSTVAVLIRTCRMGYKLPPVLTTFLQDSQVHLVGFGWASADEAKMQGTFGLGNRDFGQFTDLQQVAQGLGYHGFGLARLTRQVLGMVMPKSKRVSMSNWEAAVLSHNQVKYAALDVLLAGQVFRALRLWHSSPSLCEVCHYNLGAVASSDCSVVCECGKAYWDVRTYLTHCERTGHAQQWAECDGCGCARKLPWPSGRSPEPPGLQQP